MNYLFKPAFFIVMSILISSCGPVKLHPDNKPVRLIFHNDRLPSIDKSECEYLGPIVGSYGRWFTYLFISNKDLTYGSMDDMYNKANEIGANVVYINYNLDFTSSVTLLGQAYNCKL